MARKQSTAEMAREIIQLFPKNIKNQPTAWVREMVAMVNSLPGLAQQDVATQAVVLMLRTELTARGG